ncbi:MAG TPA: sigma-70 family RNA polymerase sigma factor [Verrucomicrobiae bacterium]|jgi:RNA polymerase sigma-70 factor (ECF subfamily)|nr:sigma-70 family RNA polymerase sigma factor [Verrucomicrobiae bacterium]
MAESVETRDVELLRRLSAGDEDAFLEFYRRHQGGLYRYAVHMCGNPQSAADVVQETFLTLIRYARNYDEKRGAPAAFLFGIARNHLRKLQEKEGRYAPLSDDFGRTLSADDAYRVNGNGHSAPKAGQAETILEDLEQAQIVKLLREAILTLPDHYREPVTLCDLQGKSYSEAAALLDCPVGTVRSRLNRARSMLLDKLRPARLGMGARPLRSGGKM